MRNAKTFAPVLLLLVCIGGGAVLLSSCLNPVGFPIEISISGEIDVNIKDPDPNKPGVTSPEDAPNLHPAPDVGVLVFKNLTGGSRAIPAAFVITGNSNENPPVAADDTLSLDAGHERSKTLKPSDSRGYTVTVRWTEGGQEKTAVISKILFAGKVEYVYFYFGKDGAYHGSGDSGDVYVNIDWNNYSDNENSGDNKDGNGESNVREGDTSSHSRNNPRTKLPRDKQDNYGILLVHNVTSGMDLFKVVFDRTQADPYVGAHYEMNPGPAKGVVQSIVLRTGTWDIAAFWPGVNPESKHASRAPVSDNQVLGLDVRSYRVNPGNNHVWFYRGTDSRYYLTDNPDPDLWQPPYAEIFELPPETGEEEDNTPIRFEGDQTNSGVDTENLVDTSGWTNSQKRNMGILTVVNLTPNKPVSKVEIVRASTSSSFTMSMISPKQDRSMLLGKSPESWVITLYYNNNADSETITRAIKPAGYTRLVNRVYFYFNGTDWVLAGDDDGIPQDRTEGGYVFSVEEGAQTNSGEKTENLIDLSGWDAAAKNTFGILTVVNLTPDRPVSKAVIARSPDTYQMGVVGAKQDRSMILRKSPANWTVTVYYHNDAYSKTITRSIKPLGGTRYINRVYFYYDGTDYALAGEEDLPVDLTPGIAIPPGKGRVYVHNDTAAYVIDRVGIWRTNGAAEAGNEAGAGFELASPDYLKIHSRNSGSFDLLPGSYFIRVRLDGKGEYSPRIFAVNVQEGRVENVFYLDSFEIEEPPTCYGQVWVRNMHANPGINIERIEFFEIWVDVDDGSVDMYPIPEQTRNDLIVPSRSAYYPLPASRHEDPEDSFEYMARIYVSDPTVAWYEESFTFGPEETATLRVHENTPRVTIPHTVHSPTGVDLRIVNAYGSRSNDPLLPFKIFSAYIAKSGATEATYRNTDFVGGVRWQEGTSPMYYIGINEFYDVAGKDDGGYNEVGMDSVVEGYYSVWIWGGSVSYSDHVPDMPGNPTFLYNLGNHYLTQGTRKTINVDVWSVDPEIADSVLVTFTHTGNIGIVKSAAPLLSIDVVVDASTNNFPVYQHVTTNNIRLYRIYHNDTPIFPGQSWRFRLPTSWPFHEDANKKLIRARWGNNPDFYAGRRYSSAVTSFDVSNNPTNHRWMSWRPNGGTASSLTWSYESMDITADNGFNGAHVR